MSASIWCRLFRSFFFLVFASELWLSLFAVVYVYFQKLHYSILFYINIRVITYTRWFVRKRLCFARFSSILFLFLTSQLSISDYKCPRYLIIHFLPFPNCNFQLLIVDHKYLQYWIVIFSQWIVEIHKLIFRFISLSDADRWSRKLRRWQTSSSHNLLANGEWWSPVEDSENLHVPRSSKTSTLLDVR